MKKAFLLLLFFATPSIFAADVNGYTSQYECRAGGQNCNVDVAAYTTAACAQTITTTDTEAQIENKLNTGSSPICISNGDYTGKGIIDITASGSSGAYRVLRYYRSGDTDDDPWNQSDSDRVKIRSIRNDTGASYWIFHRLSFMPYDSSTPRINLNSTTAPINNVIINRILGEGRSAGFSNAYSVIQTLSTLLEDVTNITVQNSVIRNGTALNGTEPMGLNMTHGTNIHAVNNEIYDWSAHPAQFGNNTSPTMLDTVFENNDVYATSAMWLENGKGYGKALYSNKHTSSSSYPTRIIHNRFWGGRDSDNTVCCINGDSGTIQFATSQTTGSDSYYALVKDNIILDSQKGLAFYNKAINNSSIIGNIVHGMQKYASDSSSYGIVIASPGNLNDSEIYLNSFINSSTSVYNMSLNTGQTNDDIRCNAYILAGDSTGTGPGANTQLSHNVYYSTNKIYSGENSPIENAIFNRTNSTYYAQNNVLRTTTTAPADGTSGDFLYKVTVAGTSASSPPSYCTTLGCTMTDGSMTVKGIRGPYSFYRKLKTGAELKYIPYAKVHTSAPEYNYCTAANMGSALGSRTGIGVNNDTAGF